MDGPAPGRNRYADLLRVLAMAGVVYGHWLLVNVTDTGGQLGGMDALSYISWSRWGTLLFQVMPVFFLVGGYVNARSWTAHSRHGLNPAPLQSPLAPRVPWAAWARWIRHRAVRLLRPATVYVAVAVVAVIAARMAGASPGEVAEAGWLVALQLWFLPVYLLVIALTPALLAAHRRWGLAVPAAMALGAAVVDAAVLGLHLAVAGYANYLLVWGAMHQLGFGWEDGTLTRPRWRPYALAATGALLLTGLLLWSPFPVDMIGDGEPVTNTTPPSIALLARRPDRPGPGRRARRLPPAVPPLSLAPRQPPEHPRHHRLPLAHGPGHRHRRYLLPLRHNAPAPHRQRRMVAPPPSLVRPAHPTVLIPDRPDLSLRRLH